MKRPSGIGRGPLFILLAALIATECGQVEAASYKITEIIKDRAIGSRLAINAKGQIIGMVVVAGNLQAFLWTPGVGVQYLGGPPFPQGFLVDPGGINAAGQVTGSLVSPTDANRVFRWTPGGSVEVLLVIPDDVENSGESINTAGQVTGRGKFLLPNLRLPNAPPTPVHHAFVWTPGGKVEDLGVLGPPPSPQPHTADSWGFGINDAGQVTGYSRFLRTDVPEVSGIYHAFRWTPNVGFEDLNTLGGLFSSGLAINASGQVAGNSQISSGEFHAFLWTPGLGMRDLGTLGESLPNSPPFPSIAPSAALGINSAGHVVGEAKSPAASSTPRFQRAFLWTSATGMLDLNALVPQIPGLLLTEAHGINDKGQIVAVGCNISGPPGCHVFLLEPACQIAIEGAKEVPWSFDEIATNAAEPGSISCSPDIALRTGQSPVQCLPSAVSPPDMSTGCLVARTQADAQGNSFELWCGLFVPGRAIGCNGCFALYVRNSDTFTVTGKCWFEGGRNDGEMLAFVDPKSRDRVPLCFTSSKWVNYQICENRDTGVCSLEQDPPLPNEANGKWKPRDSLLDRWSYQYSVTFDKLDLTVSKGDGGTKAPPAARDTCVVPPGAGLPVCQAWAEVFHQDPSLGGGFNDIPPVVESGNLGGTAMTVVPPELRCDLNADGKCDSADIQIFRGLLGSCHGQPSYKLEADANGDGCITAEDEDKLFRMYPIGIQVTPTGPTIAKGTTLQFTATGRFADGSARNVTESTQVRWSSSDTNVARIDSLGLATAAGVGRTTITARAGFSVVAQAVLNVGTSPRQRGDLNGDGQIDTADVAILMRDLNKTVEESACGESCDLDGDGRITVLDARILSTLCTRARCATR
jgi:probable HAF family extracellular repeat protein